MKRSVHVTEDTEAVLRELGLPREGESFSGLIQDALTEYVDNHFTPTTVERAMKRIIRREADARLAGLKLGGRGK